MKWLHIIAFILVIIGGINWGIIGLLGTDAAGAPVFDLVQFLFGFSGLLVSAIYTLVGISAVYLLATHTKDCRVCGKAV